MNVLHTIWNPLLYVRQICPTNPVRFEGHQGSLAFNLPDFVSREVPALQAGATAQLSPWLANPHLQTAYTAWQKFKDVDAVVYDRVMLHYADGGQGSLDIAMQDNHTRSSTDTKPMLVVLHGLTGGSHESYVRTVVSKIVRDHEFAACVLNNRGCAETPLSTPRMYNGGWTNDIRYCMSDLRARYPNRTFYIVGFSLGASILTNYLAEQGQNSDIALAVALGTPFDLQESSNHMMGTLLGSQVYARALGKSLLALVEKHQSVLTKDDTYSKAYDTYAAQIKTSWDFDEYITGPMFGYRDARDFYKDASSLQRIHAIRTPYIALSSHDDPIVGPITEFLAPEFKRNPYTLLIETSTGGHIGWLTNTRGARWYSDPVCSLLHRYHEKVVLQGLEPTINTKHLPQDILYNVKMTWEDDKKPKQKA